MEGTPDDEPTPRVGRANYSLVPKLPLGNALDREVPLRPSGFQTHSDATIAFTPDGPVQHAIAIPRKVLPQGLPHL